MIRKSYKNNVFILDWDDTLFPTSGPISEFDGNIQKYYLDLDMIVSSFVYGLLERGNIYIVTAANYEWILNLLKKLTRTQNALKNSKIISSNSYPYGDKKIIFFDIYNVIRKDGVENVISIGDSDNEKNSIISLRNYVSKLDQNKLNQNIFFVINNTLSYPRLIFDTNQKKIEKCKNYFSPYVFYNIENKKALQTSFKSIKLPKSPGFVKLAFNLKSILSNIDFIINDQNSDFFV